MFEVLFNGNDELRADLRRISEDHMDVISITEENGADGFEALRILTENGKETLEFLTALAVFIKACIDAKRSYSISIRNKDTKKTDDGD